MMRRALLLLSLCGCRIGFDDLGPISVGDGGARVTVTVIVEGDGTGTVVSTPAGISCPGTCEAQLPSGTITLTATAGASSFFGGWSQPGCSGAACIVDLTAPQTITARFTGARNVIFVSSRKQAPGSFGGVAAADTLCTNLAAQSGLTGNYIALLSTTTATATSRLGAARGWIRPDGLPVADTAADLIGGHHFYPPNLDETGWRVDDALLAVTGTNATGTTASTCSDYAVTATGNATASSPHVGSTMFIAAGGTVPCNYAAPIYCVGTSYQVPVSVVPQTGRIAFLTPFAPGGGLVAADAACMTAAAGHLSGTFVALVATQTASALSRLGTTGGGWVRPDGVPIVSTLNDFTNGRLIAPIALHADGTIATLTNPWSGAPSIDVAGTQPSTCTDWTDMTVNEIGSVGFMTDGARFFYGNAGSSCNQSGSIYCIQP